MDRIRNVLVTGATGFIGRHLVANLPHRHVAAAVRSMTVPVRDGVRCVAVGGIDSATDWHDALRDIDAVIHLAGLAHRSGGFQADNPDLYFEVNTRGTLRLAEEAARAGVRDFVFMSSIHVNGPTSDGRPPFSETDPPRPAGPYGESKARAEEGLAALAARSDMAITIVRPPVVHGAGGRGNIARIEAALKRRLPLPLASIRNRRAFLGVDNLVAFLNWRLGRDNNGIDTFIIADEEQLSTPDFIRQVAMALDRPARLVPFPPAILRKALRATGREAMVEGLLGSLAVDTTHAARAGWRPPFTLAEGLDRAFSRR